MEFKEKIEQIISKFSFIDYKWIDPHKFVVSQWVRMKCLYGCDEYGKTATCPPNVPSIEECKRFFRDYDSAVILHFEVGLDKPEDRSVWTRRMNLKLLELEREVFISGYQKTFLIFLGSCNLCQDCPGQKKKCKKPEMARPTPESLGVDVFTTARQIGFPIEVLSDYTEKMNRYSFLMIK